MTAGEIKVVTFQKERGVGEMFLKRKGKGHPSFFLFCPTPVIQGIFFSFYNLSLVSLPFKFVFKILKMVKNLKGLSNFVGFRKSHFQVSIALQI